MTGTLSLKPSGKNVDLERLTIDDIDSDDIIICLSSIHRWTGGFKWSVAAHSMLCVALIKSPGFDRWLMTHIMDPVDRIGFKRKFGAVMILHDAHEAYLGDIIRPVANMIGLARIEAVKKTLDRMIYNYFKVLVPVRSILDAIKYIDDLALRFELQYFNKIIGNSPVEEVVLALFHEVGYLAEEYDNLEACNDECNRLFAHNINRMIDHARRISAGPSGEIRSPLERSAPMTIQKDTGMAQEKRKHPGMAYSPKDYTQNMTHDEFALYAQDRSAKKTYRVYSRSLENTIETILLPLSDAMGLEKMNGESGPITMKVAGGYHWPLIIEKVDEDAFYRAHIVFIESDTQHQFSVQVSPSLMIDILNTGTYPSLASETGLATQKMFFDTPYADLDDSQKAYADLYGVVDTLVYTHHEGYMAHQGFPVRYPQLTIKNKFTNMMQTAHLDYNLALATIHSSISKRAQYILSLMPVARGQIEDNADRARELLNTIEDESNIGKYNAMSTEYHIAILTLLYAKLELIQYWITPEYAKGRAELDRTGKEAHEAHATVPPAEDDKKWEGVEVDTPFVHSISVYTRDHIVAAMREVVTYDILTEHDKNKDDWLNSRVGTAQSHVNECNIFDAFIQKVKDKLAEV